MIDEVSDKLLHDIAAAHGVYIFECRDINGYLKWSEILDNTVCTEGKNLLLNTGFTGSAYTVTGPYLGLIAGTGFSAVAATDVGIQINGTNGWKEAGGANDPIYTGNRPTCSWAAASGGAIALSVSASFSITSLATVQGAFILYGTGAVNTKDDANGTIWSVGTFAGGARPMGNGDTLVIAYSTSL